MTETIVMLNSVMDVKNFVRLASMCSGDVKVYSDRYIVDGKSIMGIMSIDLSKPIKVEFEGDIPSSVRDGMKELIKK